VEARLVAVFRDRRALVSYAASLLLIVSRDLTGSYEFTETRRGNKAK
jgi:hypothetical protein